MLEKFFTLDKAQLKYQEYFLGAGSLLLKSLPTFCMNFSHIIMLFTDIYTMKNLNNEVMIGGYGIGLTIIHTFFYSVIIAFTNGLFTLLSQAYGAQQYKEMGILFQKGQVIPLVYFSIIIPCLFFTKGLLGSLGINEVTAQYTQDYVRISMVAMIFRHFFESTRGYLQSQRIFDVSMYALLSSFIMYPFFAYFYVYYLDLGIFGLGLTRATCDGLGYIFLYCTLHLKYQDILKLTWVPFTTECLADWKPYMRIVAPIGLITIMEFSFWEVQTLICGSLNLTNQLAAHTSYATIEVFLFYFPLALSWTTNTYLGNFVGEKNHYKTKHFTKIVQMATLMLYVSIFILTRIFKPFFANNFAMPSYREDFEKIYDIGTVLFILGDCFQIVQSAMMRCLGLHDYCAVMFVICYYAFGLPLSILLVYSADLQVYGVWWTLVIVALTVSIIMFVKISNLDFEKQITKAMEGQEAFKKSSQDFIRKFSNSSSEQLIISNSEANQQQSPQFNKNVIVHNESQKQFLTKQVKHSINSE